MPRTHTARTRPVARMSVALVALLMLAAGCGSDEPAQESSSSTGGAATSAPSGGSGGKVVKIGVIAPLDGGLTAFGLGIEHSVQLAVDEANASGAIPGWTIEVVAMDDSSDPEKGREAAEAMAQDDAVIGVVGTYNSGVAAEVAPVLDAAGIAMISPSNTDPTLSVGDEPHAPVRQHDTYFRMVATDAQQGPFLAAYAREELDSSTVAVVSETKPVSKGLADDFSAAFSESGGEVVLTEVVPDGTTEFATTVEEVAPLAPDLVFFGGEYPVAAELRQQATGGGVTAPMMGGDGIKDDEYVTLAGDTADGTIASSVGVPLDDLASAADFLAAYDAAGFPDPPSNYGPYAYDAANLLIAAAGPALADADTVTPEARAEVVAGVQAAEVEGITGPIAFDEFGDTTNRVLTVYRVTDGAWVPVFTRTVD